MSLSVLLLAWFPPCPGEMLKFLGFKTVWAKQKSVNMCTCAGMHAVPPLWHTLMAMWMGVTGFGHLLGCGHPCGWLCGWWLQPGLGCACTSAHSVAPSGLSDVGAVRAGRQGDRS